MARLGPELIQLNREGIAVRPEPLERATFNPGAALDTEGNIHLVFRANLREGPYISRLGHAISQDVGVSFIRQPAPRIIYDTSLASDEIALLRTYEANCVEDPKLICIDGKWFATLVYPKKPAFSEGQQALTVLAETDENFHTFNVLGILTPDEFLETGDCRNTVLWPRRTQAGSYVMLHRPQEYLRKDKYGRPVGKYVEFGRDEYVTSSTWISESDNLLAMPPGEVLMRVREDLSWEHRGIHLGPPPIETSMGLLLLTTVVGKDKKYRVGAALQDLNNPRKILARLPYPILEPRESYEIQGDACDNVVFPGGAIVIEDTLMVFYGAGDRVCARASCSLSALVAELMSHSLVRTTT